MLRLGLSQNSVAQTLKVYQQISTNSPCSWFDRHKLGAFFQFMDKTSYDWGYSAPVGGCLENTTDLRIHRGEEFVPQWLPLQLAVSIPSSRFATAEIPVFFGH